MGLKVRASDLREEYRQAIASPLVYSKIHHENGLPIILFSNDWVRILLVRRDGKSLNTIEVELSVSGRSDATQMNHQQTISTLINHLNYLLRLHEYGFRLEAMEDDVLWTAAMEVSLEPHIELFQVLLPPYNPLESADPSEEARI